MFISRYFVLFVFYSFCGWVYETIYCTVKEHSWQNRGFLYGPICPIYGTGAVLISIIMDYLGNVAHLEYTWWQVFLIGFFGSMILEYVTSYVMEVLFHAVWWDYHNMPLNLHGRTCVPAGLLFALGGLLIVYQIYPVITAHVDDIPQILMEGLSLLVMAVFSADVTLTVNALTQMDKIIEASGRMIDQRMESVVQELNYTNREAIRRIKALRPSVKHTKEHHEKRLALLRSIKEHIRNK